MKNLQIQTVFLVFILILPIALSTIQCIGDVGDKFELCENSSEEEQNEERETEEETENVEALILNYQIALEIFQYRSCDCFSKNKPLFTINKDVSTPPPEFG